MNTTLLLILLAILAIIGIAAYAITSKAMNEAEREIRQLRKDVREAERLLEKEIREQRR